MHPNGTSTETEASVERVKAWKRHRVGRRPPFRDYKIYYRTMRWGPFSYWTWRGIAILVSGALILYAVLSMVRNPLTWFVQP
jgi:hypothetical protein